VALRRVEIDQVDTGAVVDDRFQDGQCRHRLRVDTGPARRHHHSNAGRALSQVLGPTRTVGKPGNLIARGQLGLERRLELADAQRAVRNRHRHGPIITREPGGLPRLAV